MRQCTVVCSCFDVFVVCSCFDDAFPSTAYTAPIHPCLVRREFISHHSVVAVLDYLRQCDIVFTHFFVVCSCFGWHCPRSSRVCPFLSTAYTAPVCRGMSATLPCSSPTRFVLSHAFFFEKIFFFHLHEVFRCVFSFLSPRRRGLFVTYRLFVVCCFFLQKILFLSLIFSWFLCHLMDGSIFETLPHLGGRSHLSADPQIQILMVSPLRLCTLNPLPLTTSFVESQKPAF